MGLTSFIGIGIGLIILTMILLILKTGKRNTKKKPYLLSFFALSFIILNWVLYLVGFYAIIAEKTGDLLFLTLWIMVSIVGLLSAYKEYNNNPSFAIVTGGLAIINSVLGILIWGIGNI